MANNQIGAAYLQIERGLSACCIGLVGDWICRNRGSAFSPWGALCPTLLYAEIYVTGEIVKVETKQASFVSLVTRYEQLMSTFVHYAICDIFS